jgi:hypothetical protein
MLEALCAWKAEPALTAGSQGRRYFEFVFMSART